MTSGVLCAARAPRSRLGTRLGRSGHISRARSEDHGMRHVFWHFLVALLLLATTVPASATPRELRLSHQWPGSDARHKAARVLAAELKNHTSGLSIIIHAH